MKKLILMLTVVLFATVANAQTWYSWRYNSSADCDALTTGKLRDLCFETSTNDVYKCVPTSGDCDTAAEWERVGSYVTVELLVVDYTTDVTAGDGKAYFYVPARLNGMVLSTVLAQVITAGGTNVTNIDLARCTDHAGYVCDGTNSTVTDMLSTNLTIDSGEVDSSTAATAAVIDTDYDDVSTGQIIRVDIDQVSGTEPKGLIVTLTFIRA